MGSYQLSAFSRQLLIGQDLFDISHKFGVKGVKHS
jgi:hypothetical protein